MFFLIFFCSLVTKDELLNQYPDATHLIDYLPASWNGCFKPEAHLLIEKFLSLKKKNSRDIFVDNMIDHTSARRQVSIIVIVTILKVQRNAQALS